MTAKERGELWAELRRQLDDSAVNWNTYLYRFWEPLHEVAYRAKCAAHEARRALDAYEALKADDETPCYCCREHGCEDGCRCSGGGVA